MIDGSVLQSAQKCFEKKSRVVVKMVVRHSLYVQSKARMRTSMFNGKITCNDIVMTADRHCVLYIFAHN